MSGGGLVARGLGLGAGGLATGGEGGGEGGGAGQAGMWPATRASSAPCMFSRPCGNRRHKMAPVTTPHSFRMGLA